MGELIAVLNSGSSSLKFALFGREAPERAPAVVRGQIDGIGGAPRFRARDERGQAVTEPGLAAADGADHEALLRWLLGWIRDELHGRAIVAVGHRVVHGGPDLSAPMRIDAAVLATLESLVPLAPLHQPQNLAAIKAVTAFAPDVAQVACFDTAFHHDHPAVADHYALPRRFHDGGIRRYGFHGLSYESIVRAMPGVAPALVGRRLVVAHLGNGASLCAIAGGRSIDSTMGFSALDGIPMGTRCGELDPGVLIYLLTEGGLDAKAVERLLYTESGLLGLSGISGDMRALQQSDAPGAALALDYFVYRVSRAIGSLAAALGGLEGLVFTAGIGENSVWVRERVCRQAAWLGLELDPAANRQGGPCITTPGSRVSAWIIPTDEERMIAWHTVEVLARS